MSRSDQNNRPDASDGPLEGTLRDSAKGLSAITRKAPEAEADLAQDAWLKLVETTRKQEVHAPRHLLFRMARNLVIDHHRHQARTQRLFRDHRAYESLPSTQPDPERSLLAADRLKRAFIVIQNMPPRRRQAFLMHRVEGLSYLDIARVMGVSVKAVEKHISLAMLELVRGMQDLEV